MKLDPFEFSTCSLGLLLTGIKAIFDQFPWPTTYRHQAIFDQFPWPTTYRHQSHFRPVPLAYYSPASSHFRPVPLAYYLLTGIKPFSTSSLGLLLTGIKLFSTSSLGLLLTGIKAIFDQFPWPITYLLASSHFRPVPLAYYLLTGLKPRSQIQKALFYFQTLLLHLKCWEKICSVFGGHLIYSSQHDEEAQSS